MPPLPARWHKLSSRSTLTENLIGPIYKQASVNYRPIVSAQMVLKTPKFETCIEASRWGILFLFPLEHVYMLQKIVFHMMNIHGVDTGYDF
jgi:hypothetical protein